MPRKNATTPPLPVFVRLFRVIFQSPEKRYVNKSNRTFAIHTRAQTVDQPISVHRVVAIRVPVTSTDTRIHVTMDDESPKGQMNKPRASRPINITPPLTQCFLQRNDTRSRNSSIRDRSRLAPTIGGPGSRLPPPPTQLPLRPFRCWPRG